MMDELKPCPFCGGEAVVMYAVTTRSRIVGIVFMGKCLDRT